MQKTSCNHLVTAKNLPLRLFNENERLACSDCGCLGPNLWICLYGNCCHIGCSENDNDHSTIHNADNPAHCVHMNWATKRIWCYICNTEVFLDPSALNNYDSDQEMEMAPHHHRIWDNGGGYSTVRTNSPERQNVFAFDKTVGLNVGMSGDAYDASDAEETSITSNAPERPFGLVGLKNMGNTCYMNAALQALSNATPLTRFFLDCPAIVQILSENKKPYLSRSYQNLMTDMWKKNAGSVSPSGILYGIRLVHAMFRGFYQHDTQEFLRNFMDQLHEELKQPSPSDPSSSSADSDTFSLAMSSSYDSSEGEYETCDSGVSERSSLSDDTERPSGASKRRLSRSSSPGTRHRTRLQSTTSMQQVINSQPGGNSGAPITSSSSSATTTLNKKQYKFRSIISDIFDGKLLSSVQCLTCDRISSRVETFQDLSLPIPSRDHLVVLHGRTVSPTATCSEAVMPVNDGWVSWIWTWLRSWFYGPVVTLHDCLAAFFSTDELKGDNMYSCERCNKLRNGVKFSKVLQLPEVLCIHLKRFRHELMFSSKISSAVSFPLRGLDMRPYLHSECVSKVTTYELFSVICHYGTAGGGHYICYALNNGQWYEFDDQYVTKVTAERVQSCEAYVLFYRKSTTTAEEIRSKAKAIYVRSGNTEDDIMDAFISRQWLNRFNTCAEPGPIDNSDFLCQHGSVNPDRELMFTQLAQVIPETVYDFLYKKFGGCPPVTTLNICQTCLDVNKRLLNEMELFISLNKEAQCQNAQMTHLISNTWYNQWQKFVHKRVQEAPGPVDNSKINLSQIDPNECIEIPESIWNFFVRIYGGGPEYRIRPRGNCLRRTESESSLQHSDGEAGEHPQFVIPSLGREKYESNHVDRSAYCSGEPMDVDQVEPEMDDPDGEKITNGDGGFVPSSSQPPSPSQQQQSEQRLTNGYVPTHSKMAADDGSEDDVSNEIKISKRRRRRKALLPSIN